MIINKRRIRRVRPMTQAEDPAFSSIQSKCSNSTTSQPTVTPLELSDDDLSTNSMKSGWWLTSELMRYRLRDFPTYTGVEASSAYLL
ncbi:hypothetical protein Ancab_027608 [Ancistrocladus abbreviatus]